MGRILIGVGFLALMVGMIAVGQHRPAKPGPWLEGASGFNAAMEQQRRNHTPLLLYFHTDWCGYCKRLDHDLLPSLDTQPIVKVRLNPERSPAERAIAEEYGVSGYPSLFVQSGERRVRLHPFVRDDFGRWNEEQPAEFVAEVQHAR